MKKGSRKEELLSIALELFLSNGFEKTSVKDIYTRASGSFGMFYHHFESKEAIFKEAMARYVDGFLQNISGVLLDKAVPFQTRCANIIQLYIEFLNGRDRASGGRRTEMDMGVFRHLALTILNESIPVMQKFIEEGRDAGLLRFEDGETTATFLIYGVYGMVRRQSLAESNNQNAAQMLQGLTPFLMKMLGAEWK